MSVWCCFRAIEAQERQRLALAKHGITHTVETLKLAEASQYTLKKFLAPGLKEDSFVYMPQPEAFVVNQIGTLIVGDLQFVVNQGDYMTRELIADSYQYMLFESYEAVECYANKKRATVRIYLRH